jgi:hypothetical protein
MLLRVMALAAPECSTKSLLLNYHGAHFGLLASASVGTIHIVFPQQELLSSYRNSCSSEYMDLATPVRPTMSLLAIMVAHMPCGMASVGTIT